MRIRQYEQVPRAHFFAGHYPDPDKARRIAELCGGYYGLTQRGGAVRFDAQLWPGMVRWLESAGSSFDPVRTVSASDLKDAIRSLHYRTASFHLSPCHRCTQPSFQQPCPSCGFYPMGHRGYQLTEAQRKPYLDRFTDDWWVAEVERRGGVLGWYLYHSMRSERKVVDQGQTADFIQRKAASWTFPSASEIHAHVTATPFASPRS